MSDTKQERQGELEDQGEREEGRGDAAKWFALNLDLRYARLGAKGWHEHLPHLERRGPATHKGGGLFVPGRESRRWPISRRLTGAT